MTFSSQLSSDHFLNIQWKHHLIGNSLEMFSPFAIIILFGELHPPPYDFSTDAEYRPEEAKTAHHLPSSCSRTVQPGAQPPPPSTAQLSSHCLKPVTMNYASVQTGTGKNTLGLNNIHLDWNTRIHKMKQKNARIIIFYSSFKKVIWTGSCVKHTILCHNLFF